MDSLKILHRIYFGFDGKVDLYQEYLKNWEEQLPDYKIIHWNADNLPITICEYTRELFKEKDHAFLSDYFRWWVLREYGGIYLDADIEIINGEKFNILVEELENNSEYHSFIGIEDISGYTAHSVACKKNSPLTQFMCSIYENMGQIYHLRKRNKLLAPQLTLLYFYDQDSRENFEIPSIISPIIINNIMIYPQEYFSPLGYTNEGPILHNIHLENVCLCHHFSGSWLINTHNIKQNKQLLFSDYLKMNKKFSIKKTILRNINPSFQKSFLFKISRMFYRILKFIYHEIKNILKK
ncbi:MAG: hypothetical protein KFW21_06930 [Spirochaetota bacterium]|nr:hypothetical protein [Spirochaetota bacterium]